MVVRDVYKVVFKPPLWEPFSETRKLQALGGDYGLAAEVASSVENIQLIVIWIACRLFRIMQLIAAFFPYQKIGVRIEELNLECSIFLDNR